MKTKSFRLLFLIAASAVAAGHLLRAQDIIVVTGTIQGTVSSPSLPVTQLQVSASPQFPGSSTSTSTPFVQGGSASTPYSLLVGLPQAGTGTFNVFVTIFSDANQDSLRPSVIPITVSSGSPATLNYTLPDVGYITPVFTITNAPGATVISASLSATFNAVGISESASTNGNLAAISSFAVIPRTNIQVTGTVRLSNGVNRSLGVRVIDVAAGMPTEVLYTVDGTPPPPPPPPPATNGSIGGTMTFSGDMPVQRFEIQTSGPTSRSVVLQPPPVDGAYVVSSLAAGTYSMFARVRLNNFDDFLQLPVSAFSPSQSGIVVGDVQTTVNISASQSFLNGTLLLNGGATLVPFLTSGTVSASGLAASTAAGASASDQLQVSNRAIDLVLTPGDWRVNGITMSFSRPAPGLSGSLSYTPVQVNPTLTLTPNATLHHDIPLDLGELTLTITSAGGQTFSNPRVDGNCIQRDAANVIQYQSSFSFSTFNQNNVSQGSVTLVSTSGRCTLTPRVVVGSQTLTLPSVTIDLVAGASQTVDVGGPTLTITSPSPGLVTSSFVNVTGRATDDVAVASVLVNDQAASISSANNPADPREIVFSRFISPLVRGPNVITTVASDTSVPAKTATDTRTVCFDTQVPSLIVTAPVNGSTFATSAAVTGSATDDAGLQRITVNGTDTAFAPSGGANNEVSFSTSVPLNVGANTVTVVATDLCNRTTTVVRSVTREQGVPTSLSIASASGVFGGSVSLTATLTAGGSPVAGKTIVFALNGATASATTSAQGTASAGLSLAGLNAGSYPGVISASFAQDETHLASSATGDLTIGKATATLTLAALLHVYDGGPKAATVTTSPAGLGAVTVLYDGSAALPTNAGSYAVSATLNNANYQAAAAAATLIIDRAAQAITFAAPAPATFGDAPVELAASATSGVPVTFSASGPCTLTGTTLALTAGGMCTITATQPGNGNFYAAPPVTRALTIAWPWTGVLPPVNADGTSVFKLNSTVPVKFALADAAAGVGTLAARIYLAKVSSGVLGSELEPVSTSAADAGNLFRYDPSGDQYIFNLGTKSLSQGTWQVRIDLGDGSTHVVMLSLKK